MDQNTAAISALLEYATIDQPGYAFMIEAPWGAGKTHLVKREFKEELSNDEARYVTLNGVSDRTAFRRAVLAGTSVAKLGEAASSLGDILGKAANVGAVGSFFQNALEDRMMGNLPKLLIFDDVERCEMSPSELLGLINEFVEHQAKNVVLCAFIERDTGKGEERREEFLSRKEKVVGRTVRITADAANALPEFIAAMPGVRGKQWFQSHSDLVLDVFFEANHGNLRVLRQCVHDCGRVIDVLENDIVSSEDGMVRFVRTYLALAMAASSGEINSASLLDRSEHHWLKKPEDGVRPNPLYTCSQQHPHAEIFAGNSASVLPVGLAFSLIGMGYEQPNKINSILRETGQFMGEQSVPLWRRFVAWRKMSSTELEATHREALSYAFENDEIEPGPYLHVACDLILIADAGHGKGDETAIKIKDRIADLADRGKIPAAAYGHDFGWSVEVGRYSFGGYGFEPGENATEIIEAMKAAQIDAFEKLKHQEADRLLSLLKKDPEAFGDEFSWSEGNARYHNTAVLRAVDASQFAKVIFDHLRNGDFEKIGPQIQVIGRRHFPNIMPEELAWANLVKSRLIELAEEAGPLASAQMSWFLKFNWGFPRG